MLINYDKETIKEQLSVENLFELLDRWGGEPEYTSFGILSATICHNEPGVGSRKLYWYENSGLFICYSGCEEHYFDIFELTRKVARIQWHKEFDLNDAVRWVAQYFGIIGELAEDDKNELEDWDVLNEYDKVKESEESKENSKIVLKEYDDTILPRFNYDIRITPWLDEGITQDVIAAAGICYYPGGDQIVIPHFDIDNRLVGIRGRTVCKEEAERFGKYRPLKVNGEQYNHPLGLNLYGLNWSKDNIKTIQKAIVFESEKSVLKYASYFGWENNIAVACCGSNLSAQQVQFLLDAGATEIVVAYDKQYEALNTDESLKWEKKLRATQEKYKSKVLVSLIWDKYNLLGYKDSPIDRDKYTFLELFKKRIIL